MTSLQFFRTALLLPLGLPVVTLLLGPWPLHNLFEASFAFGGVQYAAFAAAMFYAFGRCETDRQRLLLTLAAPVLFLPIQLGGWIIVFPPRGGFDWAVLTALAGVDIAFGYLYVCVCAATHWACRRMGWMRPTEHRFHGERGAPPSAEREEAGYAARPSPPSGE